MTKKAIYKPTNQKTVILQEFDEYCEILLDGEYKSVLKTELLFEDSASAIATLNALKENIFLSILNNPISDILYSFNTNRVSPEIHQYKPLIKFLNSQNSRVLIADEVGLGKTIEAGMIFKEIDKREELKISLIVVPSSLTLKWQEEFEIRFDEHFEIYKTNDFIRLINEFDDFNTSRFFSEKIIISYHTLRDERVMKKLENSFFEVDFLIMDEAHTMRNTGTSTYRSVELITSISEHIIFLSATPVQNALSDLFNILSLLDSDYFRDYDYFEKMIRPNAIIHKLIAHLRNNISLSAIKEFCFTNNEVYFEDELKKIFDEISTLLQIDAIKKVELIDRLTKCDHLSFIINRTKKKDVGMSIPRSAKSAVVQITNAEQEYYNAVIEFVKFLNPSTPQGFITIMPERMASSSMIASLESFKAIKKSGKIFFQDIDDLEDYYDAIDIKKEAQTYLDKIIVKGELIGDNDSKFLKFEEILKEINSLNIKQVILFSFFKKTLDYLHVKLQSLGYRVGKIHGDFSVEERFGIIKEFKKGSFDILLSSEVGSEGLDMQFCNVVVNYDLPWNPMRVEQRIGRIDRIGQKFDKLHIFNLCISGSIEDRIYSRLYSKLGIFENSIGELEPILGELEKELNISQMISLSQEEIDKKLYLQELAIKRAELEIKEQSKEVEKLISDDFSFKQKENQLINPQKIAILQRQCREIFLKFLEKNDVGYFELKDESLKFSSENLKRLFDILKNLISDKREEPSKYKTQRQLIQKISRYKELKVTFDTNNNDEFQTLYIFLDSPIISMITKESLVSFMYSSLTHTTYKNAYAIIYRAEFLELRSKNILKTMIVDSAFAFAHELDYFEFMDGVLEDSKETFETANIKQNATVQVIKSLERQKDVEQQNQNRQIDIKINSIKSHFEKQINKVKRVEEKLHQDDVKRMRTAEIENLKKQRDKKVEELEAKREVKSSFEILGIVRL
ncbi:MAG: helicase-related protein [Sulfurimonas sp.]|nr:helicase-related protein [Sulfurimonas sp.]